MQSDFTRTRGFSLGTTALTTLAALTVMLVAAAAHAGSQPFTFAQFIQATQSANSNQFAYLDNGPDSNAEITTQVAGVNHVAIPVIFTFQAVNGTLPADLQGPQQATLTLISITTASIQTANVFGETLGQQQFFGSDDVTDTLAITRDTAAAEGNGTMTNLLTMTFTGALLGQLGQTTPSLSGNTNGGDTVDFTSDFLDFSGSASNDFNMAFSSWTTIVGGGGLTESPTLDDSYFASATAAGAATFDSAVTPVITTQMPEPGISTVALALGLLMLARPRRAAATA